MLTGLDRVMIYRFHADESGEVFAESRRTDLPSWQGWRYPAHDIPKPAREIFKRIWIRPVPNIRATLAELVPLANPDTGGPLEMTHCSLRGPSVMYTEYLANMGVGAALTMSLMRNGELWGLIACHHYTPIHFPYQLRAACEFLAQNASLQLQRAEDREDDEYRRAIDAAHYAILSRAATQSNLAPLVVGSPNLRSGIRCDGVAMLHRGEWWTDGRTPTIPQMKALVDWLRASGVEGDFSRTVFETDVLPQKYPPAVEFAAVASGLLAVRIDAAASSAVLWFRVETIQTFTWGGNPHELPLVAGPNGPRLTPRKSFELWEETVRNRALPWRGVEKAAAARLRQLLLDLVVTRLEELAALNTELQRSNAELDAFAALVSHDLKEPLRGISKYARQLGAGVRSHRDALLLLLLLLRRAALLLLLLLLSVLSRQRLVVKRCWPRRRILLLLLLRLGVVVVVLLLLVAVLPGAAGLARLAARLLLLLFKQVGLLGGQAANAGVAAVRGGSRVGAAAAAHGGLARVELGIVVVDGGLGLEARLFQHRRGGARHGVQRLVHPRVGLRRRRPVAHALVALPGRRRHRRRRRRSRRGQRRGQKGGHGQRHRVLPALHRLLRARSLAPRVLLVVHHVQHPIGLLPHLHETKKTNTK